MRVAAGDLDSVDEIAQSCGRPLVQRANFNV
jgi:hypothetical protein